MLTLERNQTSQDGSVKVLWKLHDGQSIESVILPRQLKQIKKIELWLEKSEAVAESVAVTVTDGETKTATATQPTTQTDPQTVSAPSPRFTACLSSQVGCAMACDFCLTGKQGFTRNLTHQEIVDQVLGLQKIKPIHNIVFMGMGEPLQNIEEVVKAIQFLKSPRGLKFSKRKILVSTSGVISALPRLAETGVRLAISLNATTDTFRSQIMPINRKHPIRSLISAAMEYGSQVKQTVMVEYVLMKGFNDSVEDEQRLYELTHDWDCKVNLIPYNPFLLPGMVAGPYQRPDFRRVKDFQHALVSRGVTTTVRYSGGDDILAACGQLKSVDAEAKRGFSLA